MLLGYVFYKVSKNNSNIQQQNHVPPSFSNPIYSSDLPQKEDTITSTYQDVYAEDVDSLNNNDYLDVLPDEVENSFNSRASTDF